MVVQGQVVVLVGESGWATGPHLHLNVLVNGGIDRFDGGINGGVMKYSAEAVDTAMT